MKIKGWTRVTLISVAAFACLIFGAGCAGGTSSDEFKTAFENDSIVSDGVVRSDYVKETPYSVTSFDVGDTETDGDTTISTINAVIENESFRSNLSIEGRATKEDKDTSYSFRVLDSQTTPIKGIDFDKDHELEAVEATLSDDGKTCAVEIVNDYDYWFADVVLTDTYTYSFSSDRGWRFDKDDRSDNTTYKDLEGTYSCPAGTVPQYSDFTISDLDAETGEFEIAFTQDENPRQNIAEVIYAAASVNAKASIEPQEGTAEKGAMDDGLIYAFKATGTSDKGSKTASIEGYIGVDSSGNQILFLTESKVATTITSKNDRDLGWEPKNDYWTVKDLVLTKQPKADDQQ